MAEQDCHSEPSEESFRRMSDPSPAYGRSFASLRMRDAGPRMTGMGLRMTVVMLALSACSPADQRSPASGANKAPSSTSGAGLTGAGATFPNPIYTKWFDAYKKESGVRINYQSIGSGGGIRQFTEGTVDFAASDAPMTDAQVAAVKGNVLHIPTVLGAVVATYNLPSAGATALRLDGATLAEIFLGRISRWSDPRIKALNPGVNLPNQDIIV